MKVFVGTMECGENEFEKCKESISSQIDVQTFHYVVSNLPEKEAHEKLFLEWNKSKKDYDLFLKVDADTVLSHNLVIKTFVELFKNDDKLTGVQAWLHDYMTDSLIYGLTCLKNTVSVSTKVNKLYPDRADSGHNIVIRGNELPKELIPAGMHCWFPSDKQAFHYGFHRGKKNQSDIFNKVYDAWKKNNFDKTRGLCLLGFNLSSKYNEVDYSDDDFQNAFNFSIKNYSKELILNEIKSSRNYR